MPAKASSPGVAPGWDRLETDGLEAGAMRRNRLLLALLTGPVLLLGACGGDDDGDDNGGATVTDTAVDSAVEAEPADATGVPSCDVFTLEDAEELVVGTPLVDDSYRSDDSHITCQYNPEPNDVNGGRVVWSVITSAIEDTWANVLLQQGIEPFEGLGNEAYVGFDSVHVLVGGAIVTTSVKQRGDEQSVFDQAASIELARTVLAAL
jgi:hypothetical protein